MIEKHKVINLFAGPGTGKSTTMAGTFFEMKLRGINCEMIPEYAKDLTWEGRNGKVFEAQDYIFAKQHFRLGRVAPEVSFAVTDSPLLLSLVYGETFRHTAFHDLVKQCHEGYDNLNIYLKRSASKPYNPKGRNQDEDQARELDEKIFSMLLDEKIDIHIMEFGRDNPLKILRIMQAKGWIGAEII
jgi:hypothetical protein